MKASVFHLPTFLASALLCSPNAPLPAFSFPPSSRYNTTMQGYTYYPRFTPTVVADAVGGSFSPVAAHRTIDRQAKTGDIAELEIGTRLSDLPCPFQCPGRPVCSHSIITLRSCIFLPRSSPPKSIEATSEYASRIDFTLRPSGIMHCPCLSSLPSLHTVTLSLMDPCHSV